MYYLKHGRRKLLIESDNVFTKCPRCGKEIQVDLGETILQMGKNFCLYSTQECCHRCSEKLREGKR